MLYADPTQMKPVPWRALAQKWLRWTSGGRRVVNIRCTKHERLPVEHDRLIIPVIAQNWKSLGGGGWAFSARAVGLMCSVLPGLFFCSVDTPVADLVDRGISITVSDLVSCIAQLNSRIELKGWESAGECPEIFFTCEMLRILRTSWVYGVYALQRAAPGICVILKPKY